VDIDLPFYLFWAVVICGAILLADALFFKPARTDNNPDENHEPLIVEYARSFFPVLLVVLLLRGFLAEPYQIPSESMVPTLEVGDFILVNKYAYGLRLPVFRSKIVDVGEPKRGEVMIFVPPHDPRYFIKRVIGIPGDKVRYVNKKLTINGRDLPYEFVREFEDRRFGVNTSEFIEEVGGIKHRIHKTRGFAKPRQWTVGAGEYLMMGDNRDRSADSRTWGMATEENIVGKAIAIWAHKPPGLHWPTFRRNRWFATVEEE
jgi:signal peptidase I